MSKRYVKITESDLKAIHSEMINNHLTLKEAAAIHSIPYRQIDHLVNAPANEEERKLGEKILLLKENAAANSTKTLINDWVKKEKTVAGDFLKSTSPRFNIKTKMIVDDLFGEIDLWMQSNVDEETYQRFLNHFALKD